MFYVIYNTPSCLRLTRFTPILLLMVDLLHDRHFVCLSFSILSMYTIVSPPSRDRAQKGHRAEFHGRSKIPPCKKDLRNHFILGHEELAS